jgi:hypothetical protein
LELNLDVKQLKQDSMHKPTVQLGYQSINSFLLFCYEQTTRHLQGVHFFTAGGILSMKCLPKSLSGGWFIDGQHLRLVAYLSE